jgi:acyl carrier protein
MAAVLKTKNEIQNWCVNYLADLFQRPASQIGPEVDFDRLGLDSALAVSMVLDLEEQLGNNDLRPELLFEYTSIAELADHLAGGVTQTVTPQPELAIQVA